MQKRVEAGGEQKGELFNQYRVSVLQHGKSSGGWLYNTVNILKTTELHTQKWLR